MTKLKILVPTNFTPQSELALLQCIFFARKTNADIVLAHVLEGSASVIKKNESSVKSEFKRIKSFYRSNYGIEIETRIEFGRVIPSIFKVAKEIKPEFIFIGKDSSSKPFYSTTINLIEGVNCPVVVITNRYKQNGCERIVLPLDLSQETKQKINLAIKIAKSYKSEIHIISATNQKDEIKISLLRNQIRSVKQIFLEKSLPVHSELIIVNGSKSVMANAINDYADDIRADLIVIMTRQENKLEKMFVGSMATELIKNSSVPVLCVSPKS
jgi:nucleotide-binding universal stress UspA family protein